MSVQCWAKVRVRPAVRGGAGQKSEPQPSAFEVRSLVRPFARAPTLGTTGIWGLEVVQGVGTAGVKQILTCAYYIHPVALG